MDVYDNKTLDNTSALFDDYFNKMDLDADIKILYDTFGTQEQLKKYEQKAYLNRLRSDNHKRYHDIDFIKLSDLPESLNESVQHIENLCKFIDPPNLLNQDLDTSEKTKKMLDNIYKKLNDLDKEVSILLENLIRTNDIKQSHLNIQYLKSLNVSAELKSLVLEKYNELVLYNSLIVEEKYENLKRQVVRANYISEIYKILKIDEENKIKLTKKEKLIELNNKIDAEIRNYKIKLQYLEDLMPEKSKYSLEFTQFKRNYTNLFVYDDTNYDIVKEKYDFLINNEKFNKSIKSFENLFIQERESILNEKKFVYEKVGIKNIKKTLDYIINFYMDKIDDESKNIISIIINNLNNNKYDITDINKVLSIIVKEIWINTVTDIYSYNPNEDYCFICSNNEFIDERYQTILITKNEINKVNNYEDYQIGFICNYNNNIMYITENEDIMTVDYDDMSNLKTPKQIEEEFINFKICNRIALNGFQTRLQAVYYIDDGNFEKYMKAVELSNMYKLPLIQLKK